MALPRRDQFAAWFKDQWETEHMNYYQIWWRYRNEYQIRHKDDVEDFSLSEWMFLEKMHRIAVQSCKEKNYHFLWTTVDESEDDLLWDMCDGNNIYWS